MTALTILKAADVAARWHADQRRKGAAGEPYIGHLLEVGALAASGHEQSNLGVALRLLVFLWTLLPAAANFEPYPRFRGRT